MRIFISRELQAKLFQTACIKLLSNLDQTLYILVENFSNDTRESFFEKELPYLKDIFRKVYILPLYPDKTVLNYSADNIEVINFNFFPSSNHMSRFFLGCSDGFGTNARFNTPCGICTDKFRNIFVNILYFFYLILFLIFYFI